MNEMISGMVPEISYQKLEPRVYNYRNTSEDKPTPTPTGTTKGPTNSKKFLQTGEVKSSLFVLGFLLMLLA
ncbi:hypothetical protein [Enterococcus sp. HY326]|uniref:hypothetical protein n=1 Tax=Enterococcus sp. HY326 TaxID=2971265 RepID=UPI002240CD49|nr:hypothetical protein [Enterococcus sp. HY326]